MGTNYNPKIVTNGLVLCLDAANRKSYPGSGTTWIDLSGRGNNGTLTNGPTFSSNGNLSFDGTNDYVNISQPNITLSPNQIFTIEAWINPDVRGNETSILISPNSAGLDHFVGYQETTQRIYIQLTESENVNNRTFVADVGSFPKNHWSHFAITINNLTVKLYVNGVLKNTSLETVPIANWTGNWRIASLHDNTGYYKGSISKISVYNRELSAAEIKQNFITVRSRYPVLTNPIVFDRTEAAILDRSETVIETRGS